MSRSIPILAVALASLFTGASVWGQEAVPAPLSLEEALRISRRSNPSFLQTLNDESLSDWDVRQAWGGLLPSASFNSSVTWQGSGVQQLGGTLTLGDLGFGNQPSYYLSNYSLGLTYNLDWATLVAPRRARADREVTRASITVAGANLTAQVTTAYVEALRQQEALRSAAQQLENARFNLRLAQGQLEVGTVTPIDVGQAEVQVGRAEVTVLQTQNALETARMRLLQQLGVGVDEEFELSTDFELSEPSWTLDELTEQALAGNPTLLARRRSRAAADLGVSASRSSYFPSLSVSTGWSGFTREASNSEFLVAQAENQVASAIAQCARTNDLYGRLANPLPQLDCSQFAFTDGQRRSIIDGNNQFPFNFERSPPSVTLTLSVPIFQGLSRERNVEAARVQRDDLEHQLREQELALQADLSIGLANVRTAYQSALLEQRNRDLADRQLTLARERYQLGAITFVELTDAQAVLAQAEGSRIAAVFAYHDAVTNLEALAGAPLRN